MREKHLEDKAQRWEDKDKDCLLLLVHVASDLSSPWRRSWLLTGHLTIRSTTLLFVSCKINDLVIFHCYSFFGRVFISLLRIFWVSPSIASNATNVEENSRLQTWTNTRNCSSAAPATRCTPINILRIKYVRSTFAILSPFHNVTLQGPIPCAQWHPCQWQ